MANNNLDIFEIEPDQCLLRHSTSVNSFLQTETSYPLSRPTRDLEDGELSFWGRSLFLKEKHSSNSPLTDKTLNRGVLPAFKKSALKTASIKLNLDQSEATQLIGMQKRERRRIYTKTYRNKQDSLVRQLSVDVYSLSEEKRTLLEEKDDLTQQIQFFQERMRASESS